ncbi:hypothetical protein LSH36_263g03023 [Paralvinella palmiformis]|uniref:Uncharacterized protein n=1 Tax=Paralvinella palmiformis TaxID=53620 RepID=A0AAD9N405_9ANNE|nr:hypothetical protein LSH36_263g03023 [Paralvinella palmiformis]
MDRECINFSDEVTYNKSKMMRCDPLMDLQIRDMKKLTTEPDTENLKESTHVEYLPKMLRFKILMQLESVDAKKVAFLFFLFINILGLGYTILVTLLIFFTTIFITLPVICQNDSEYWSRVIVLLFILFNIAINLWFVTKKKSLYQKESIHYLPDSSWSECTNCGGLNDLRLILEERSDLLEKDVYLKDLVSKMSICRIQGVRIQ